MRFFRLLLFFTLVFFTEIPAVFAHAGIWMGKNQDWFSQIQWNFVAVSISAVLGVFLFLKLFIRKYGDTFDLLDHFGLRKFFKSRFYPAIFQIPVLIIFGFIFFYLFFGSYYFSENPGSIFSWILWWPLLPLSFILIGRIWCAMCPFAWVSDFFQKYFGRFKRPPVFLVMHSLILIDLIFIFITWFDRVFGMTDRPFISGLVFLALFIAAAIFGILYERRALCRYVCFLGNVAGNYSMVSPLELTYKDKKVCDNCKTKDCFFGNKKAKGCPYYQVIPSKDTNRYCTLCANCVKTCPYDNIKLSLRPFGADFWRRKFVSFEESFFAKMLVGIVIIQNIGMLALWMNLSNFVSRITGFTDERVLFTIVYFFVISIPLTIMFFSSFISSRFSKETILQNFARFGYAFIAVDLAGHLGHNLLHFLGEGKTILMAAAGLFSGEVRQIIFQWFLNYGTVRFLQYFIIALGAYATFVLAYKIARKTAENFSTALKTALPHIIFLLLIFLFNLYIFSQPMVHRTQNIF